MAVTVTETGLAGLAGMSPHGRVRQQGRLWSVRDSLTPTVHDLEGVGLRGDVAVV